ncbi:Protein cwh43 [Microbotryomycetes sp. JL201]|nr:Protein cwh43 [Microbotryomycetes sp. JL201]
MSATARTPLQPPQSTSSVAFSGSAIAVAHTALSAGAFATALALGVGLHYQRIVKNQWFGYPQEWWPSVSATIGDWFPERQTFQILVAITSGPRFIVVATLYLLAKVKGARFSGVIAAVGVARTLACGGWVYITSSDSADAHDFFMILYLVLNIPWMVGLTLVSSKRSHVRRYRRTTASLFFAALVPLIYWYIQHKVHKRAGAYSIYSIFEWSLIALDVAFDAGAVLDINGVRILVDIHEMPIVADSDARMTSATPFVTVDDAVQFVRFLAESFYGLVFWTNMTALGPMIFYSSVWNMGLSGDEILLFASLAPVLLAIPSVRRFASFAPSVLRAMMLLGMAAHRVDDLGPTRLKMNAAAVGFGCLHYAAQWSAAANHGARVQSSVSAFLLGLLASVVLKFANYSLNPFWPIMNDHSQGRMATGGYNTVGLACGILAWLILVPVPAQSERRTPQTSRTTFAELLASSFGFGSLLFLVQFLYSDSGTTIAWSWQGHPVRGPTAMPHGILTILAMALGIVASFHPSIWRQPTFFLAACAGCYLLHFFKGWTSFAGACVLAFTSFASFPAFVAGVARHNPGISFGIAYVVYACLLLASVWTVAYAFVPYGNLLRERTDVVLAATMIGIGIGFLNARRFKLHSTRTLPARLQLALTLLLTASVITLHHRRPRTSPAPIKPGARIVTAGIWTVHFAMDGRMWESQRRMADIVRDAELDIIGLLESDVHRIVGGNRDMTQFMASTLGMYSDIGPGPNQHTWGCALLSRFPILNSTHHLLPSPNGELAPAIHATLDVYGTYVDVIVAHNGQEEDPLDRELQSRELGRLMREAQPRPVIFLGYVVTKPHAERPAPYKLLVEDGQVNDIDPADDDRWCEYILFRGLRRVAYARLNRGSNPSITDTELQVAKFVVPQDPASADFAQADQTQATRVDEDLVPSDHRFPSMFYGQGVRGHYFHVLKDRHGQFAPLYYGNPV